MMPLRLLFALLAVALVQSSTAHAHSREVAITFDDVPMVASAESACDRDGLQRFTNAFTAMVRRERVPVAIMVNLGTICEEQRSLWPELLRRWVAVGAEIGNHSFSHTDLNRVTPDVFLQDAFRKDALLRSAAKASGQKHLWFRFPELHSGETLEKKQEVQAALRSAGYTNAPVTIDNDEWLFASAYLKARSKGDPDLKARIASAYLDYMEEAFAYSETLSRSLYGREIRQVLLLHASLLNLENFPKLAERLRERGYRLISLERAVSDPAYGSLDRYAGRKGISWLQRWALAKTATFEAQPEAPQWVKDLARY